MPRKKLPSKKCTKEGCNAWAMQGKLYCRKHQQYEVKRGINAANLKHGRYSSALPARLLPTYERSLKDTHLLELRHEISVLDARACELQQMIDTGESGQSWKELGEAIATLEGCIHSKDGKGVLVAIEQIKELSANGVGEFAVWNDIQRVFKLRKELVAAESQRLLQLKQYMSLERAVVLVDALAASIHEEIEDPDTLKAIAKKFEALMTFTPNSNQAQRERAERLDEFYQSEAEHSGLF